MKDVILIGGGGHCKSVIDVIEQENIFRIAGIIDIASRLGEKIFDYEIIGTDNELPKFAKLYKYALITVGQIKSPKLRIKLFNQAKESGFILPIVISPLAYISQHSSLGEGTIVMHKAIVNANVVVGNNCILNTCSLVEHDSNIGDNCHVSTGAIINGRVSVGSNCFIGSNAVIKQSISIPESSFIKAGSLTK